MREANHFVLDCLFRYCFIMQILAKFYAPTWPHLALLGLILITTTVGHIESGKSHGNIHEQQANYEEHHHHNDDDNEFHMQPSSIKCPFDEYGLEPETEPEPFEPPHLMSDLLQDGGKKHSNQIKSNNIKMTDRWQIISNQINKLDKLWPSIMRQIEERFSKGDLGRQHHEDIASSMQHKSASENGRDFPIKYGGLWRSSGLDRDSQVMNYLRQSQGIEDDSWSKTGILKVDDSGKQDKQITQPVSTKTTTTNTVTQEKQEIKSPNQSIKQEEVGKGFAATGYPLLTSDKIQETKVKLTEMSNKSDKSSELEQQDQNRWTEPIMIHDVEEQGITNNKDLRQEIVGEEQKQPEVMQEPQGNSKSRQEVASPDRRSSEINHNSIEPPASQRVRNSLLKAADIARHLDAQRNSQSRSNVSGSGVVRTGRHNLTERESNNSTEIINNGLVLSPNPMISTGNGNGFRNESEIGSSGSPFSNSIETTTTAQPSPPPESSWENLLLNNGEPRPKFLGFGDVQKNEPLNESGRIQARLSCQFGDESLRNMTISRVEWARFVGPYDQEQASFECQNRFCRLLPVQTDTLTTIHPRPEAQTYLDTRVPSYSMTLHQVDDANYGVYRCSAMRQSGGKSEIVYRIILFE